jgi:hypothetical protein
MRSKPLELPPDVARRFLEDMRAFHAEKNTVKAAEIAAPDLAASLRHRSAESWAMTVRLIKRPDAESSLSSSAPLMMRTCGSTFVFSDFELDALKRFSIISFSIDC